MVLMAYNLSICSLLVVFRRPKKSRARNWLESKKMGLEGENKNLNTSELSLKSDILY